MQLELKLSVKVNTLEDIKKFNKIEILLKGCVTDKFVFAYEDQDGSAKQAIWNCADIDLAAFTCAFLTGVTDRDRKRIINFIIRFPYKKANNLITDEEL